MIACTRRSIAAVTRASSFARSVTCAAALRRIRLVSAVNSSQKTAKISGAIRREDRAPSTRRSSSARAIVLRFSQVPLLRAAEQPMCVAEITDMPPPQAPQVSIPENR